MKTDITPIVAAMLDCIVVRTPSTPAWLGALRHAPDYRTAGMAYIAGVDNVETLREIADYLRRAVDFEWSVPALEDALREHGEEEFYTELQVHNSNRVMYLMLDNTGHPASNVLYPALADLITDNRDDVEKFLNAENVQLWTFAGTSESARYVSYLRDSILDELEATNKWHALDTKPEHVLANRWYLVNDDSTGAANCDGVFILPVKE